MQPQSTAHNPAKPLGHGDGERVEHTVVIQRTPAELYAVWHDLGLLSRVFEHVESITGKGGGVSHWVVKGPFGNRYEWDAEVVNELENEHIGWQSLPGSEVAAAGSVHFHPAGATATEVRVLLRYDAPGGVIGSLIASLFGPDPAQQIAEDLDRLKRELEGGSVPVEDAVQIASEQSFPASDAPAWTSR